MHKDNYDHTYDNSDGKPESNLLWWCQYCNIDLKGKKVVEKGSACVCFVDTDQQVLTIDSGFIRNKNSNFYNTP